MYKRHCIDSLYIGAKCCLAVLMTACLALPSLSAASTQTVFETAEEAANSLVLAVARQDSTALTGMLGEGFRELLNVEEIDPGVTNLFLETWAKFHTLVPASSGTRLLAVGERGWTLPIPIVQEAAGWRFDTDSGAELMRIRRIGRNELSAMQAALAYHDAQLEYASQDWDADGVLAFAQKFISSPGKKDGLYWETAAGEAPSPLGPLFSNDVPSDAYHGYYYRILTAQGEHASGGAYSYLVDGRLRLGFALVAWPAEYGDSGVMSFILSRDGTLYEADLGPGGDAAAGNMVLFDPDNRWMPVLTEFIKP